MLRLTKIIWQVYNYLTKLTCQPFYNHVLIAITYSILKKLSNKAVHDLKTCIWGEERNNKNLNKLLWTKRSRLDDSISSLAMKLDEKSSEIRVDSPSSQTTCTKSGKCIDTAAPKCISGMQVVV